MEGFIVDNPKNLTERLLAAIYMRYNNRVVVNFATGLGRSASLG